MLELSDDEIRGAILDPNNPDAPWWRMMLDSVLHANAGDVQAGLDLLDAQYKFNRHSRRVMKKDLTEISRWWSARDKSLNRDQLIQGVAYCVGKVAGALDELGIAHPGQTKH